MNALDDQIDSGNEDEHTVGWIQNSSIDYLIELKIKKFVFLLLKK